MSQQAPKSPSGLLYKRYQENVSSRPQTSRNEEDDDAESEFNVPGAKLTRNSTATTRFERSISPSVHQNEQQGVMNRSPSNNSRDEFNIFAAGYVFPSWTDRWQSLDKRKAFSLVILLFVNLINYMDRSTVAGMMNSIKTDFHITSDSYLGLLQTSFVICYMVFAPIFGVLGDRYSRKWLMVCGLSIWCLATFVGSFTTNYWFFLACRAIVGIGEASYSTIAPPIISDMYCRYNRSKALALFYFAIPVGTGLGYIIGSNVADRYGSWRWGLRVTPFLGLISILLIIIFIHSWDRGESEGVHMKASEHPTDDVKSLLENKSFIYSTLAFTCVTFCTGAMMWWGPQFAFYGAKAACGSRAGCENITQGGISENFGFVMTFAGLLGVPMGSALSQALRRKGVGNGDPLICAFTLILAAPILFFALVVARYSINQCYFLTFVGGLMLNFNWSIVGDMTLYIVSPARRSIASATQILMSHAFGDATSPIVIGFFADLIRPYIESSLKEHGNENVAISQHDSRHYIVEFSSLQYSLFSVCFLQVLGGFFFFMTSHYVIGDRARADESIHIAFLNEEGGQQVGSSDRRRVNGSDDEGIETE